MKKFIGKNKADALCEHLSKEVFDMLSDTEKADYYTSLAEERVNARTPEERKVIAEAYRAIGKYRNAARFASELENEAQKQIEELQREKAERKKNIIKYGCIALGAIVLAVAVSLAVSLADTKPLSFTTRGNTPRLLRYSTPFLPTRTLTFISSPSTAP